MVKRVFDVVIEKDEDGWFIADVPALQGCHTQGKTKKEVLKNIKEAIELCLEVEEERKNKRETNFVGVEKVSVHA
ncbi:type II toxin-antitoxin system HicB family antitoxin [Candidatus Micrarchaeota archaeon]|nr:type II toxin-antitoxin system HicB family antitoxin [Candidatus Micrarchaeota archaeon]MBU2476585.1 type II toxin-antitoxin system HicB family antitoxin [Candidatus Micrarchaeota archaeon]